MLVYISIQPPSFSFLHPTSFSSLTNHSITHLYEFMKGIVRIVKYLVQSNLNTLDAPRRPPTTGHRFKNVSSYCLNRAKLRQSPVSTCEGLFGRISHIMKKLVRCFYCHFYMSHTTSRKKLTTCNTCYECKLKGFLIQ